eukprot:jgi/Ulvmu1/10303/UM060_0105.1
MATDGPVRFVIEDRNPTKTCLISCISQNYGRREPTSRGRAVVSLSAPFASLSFGSTAAEQPKKHRTKFNVHQGRLSQHVVWDKGWRLEDESSPDDSGTSVGRWWQRTQRKLSSAFFPENHEVTPDFWHWWKCRVGHRFCSQVCMMFATQSLLYALGVGATRSVAASAAVNWMLKEGLGKLARMGVATSYASNFDSDLKRARFSSSLLFGVCIGGEFLAPYVPHLFVLLASVSNVGKAVAAMAHTSTQPAVMRSFCRGDHLSDVTARCQAQNTVVDQVGIAVAAALTWAVRHNPRWTLLLPLVMYPLCFAGDIALIYAELKAVHLRTLNRARAEILLSKYLTTGQVLTPAEVSRREHIVYPSTFDTGPLPIAIAPITDLFPGGPAELAADARQLRRQPFCLRLQPRRTRAPNQTAPSQLCLKVALRRGASSHDVLAALVAACEARRRLLVLAGAGVGDAAAPAAHSCRCDAWWAAGEPTEEARAQVAAAQRVGLRETHSAARALRREGWLCDSVMLSQSERIRYSVV